MKANLTVSVIEPMDNSPEEQPEPKPTVAPDLPQQPIEPAPQPPTPVVSQHGGSRKRGLMLFILFLIVAALVSTGWALYQKHQDDKKIAAASQNKDIPLLRLSVEEADYGNLYPDMSVNDYGYTVNQQMFEGLVRYEGKTKIVPDLASKWTNPDNNTWVFTIKSGVKFHDGHTLTANDVKYSLDKVIADNSDLAQSFANTISSVEVVGNNQVKITTTQPDPALLNKLTFLYVIDANLPKGDEPSQAGTGPYEIKPGTKPADKNYQMVAFDDYHFGRPQTRALAFGSQNTPEDLLKSFNNHQYDIVGAVDSSVVKQAKNAKLFVTTEVDANYIGFNTVKPGPLQNKQVREAIRLAVNPAAIGKASDTPIIPENQLIPPAIPGYNPAIAPYKQDIAKAKQLLTQAGYPNGLTLRLSVNNGDDQKAAEIAKELKQIGITVTIDTHSNFDEFISYFSNGQADMYTVDYASDTLDGLDILTTTLPAANYNNPQVTNLLNEANATVDPAKRLKLLQNAETIINQDIPAVPLYSEVELWLMNKNYVIQQDTPSGYVPVYFYKVHLP